MYITDPVYQLNVKMNERPLMLQQSEFQTKMPYYNTSADEKVRVAARC